MANCCGWSSKKKRKKLKRNERIKNVNDVDFPDEIESNFNLGTACVGGFVGIFWVFFFVEGGNHTPTTVSNCWWDLKFKYRYTDGGLKWEGFDFFSPKGFNESVVRL